MIATIELRRVRHRLRAIVAIPQMARSYVTRFGFEPVDRRRLLRLLRSTFIEFWALAVRDLFINPSTDYQNGVDLATLSESHQITTTILQIMTTSITLCGHSEVCEPPLFQFS